MMTLMAKLCAFCAVCALAEAVMPDDEARGSMRMIGGLLMLTMVLSGLGEAGELFETGEFGSVLEGWMR